MLIKSRYNVSFGIPSLPITGHTGFDERAKVRLIARNDEFLSAVARVPGESARWFYVSLSSDGIISPATERASNTIIRAEGLSKKIERACKQSYQKNNKVTDECEAENGNKAGKQANHGNEDSSREDA